MTKDTLNISLSFDVKSWYTVCSLAIYDNRWIALSFAFCDLLQKG